jgi:hypothetical protein
VVVDTLRGLVELDRHLGARPGLGEPPQHFDPLRLEQGLSLLDLVEINDVPHDKISLYVKEFFVNGPLATITTAAVGIGFLVTGAYGRSWSVRIDLSHVS